MASIITFNLFLIALLIENSSISEIYPSRDGTQYLPVPSLISSLETITQSFLSLTYSLAQVDFPEARFTEGLVIPAS